MEKILGLHHITAIASGAQRNYDFYTGVLGLRLVKKTVNFDDPGTYHFYYGDEVGTPGTILTFFPWEGISRGYTGTGMATQIAYAVPVGSLEFWQNRFTLHNVIQGEITERFGARLLAFEDPDGLQIELVETSPDHLPKPWETVEVNAEVATRGFQGVTLTLRSLHPTATILTDVFGYAPAGSEGNRLRFATEAAHHAAYIDLVEAPAMPAGRGAAGTNHHIAFRVKDEEILMEYREKIDRRGLHITPKIDRDYFFSLYFREPGGVLFELATENPGFTRDEPVEQLGSTLQLPKQYADQRAAIEKTLPVLKTN